MDLDETVISGSREVNISSVYFLSYRRGYVSFYRMPVSENPALLLFNHPVRQFTQACKEEDLDRAFAMTCKQFPDADVIFCRTPQQGHLDYIYYRMDKYNPSLN